MWDVRAHVLCKFHAGTPVCRSAAGEKRKKMFFSGIEIMLWMNFLVQIFLP